MKRITFLMFMLAAFVSYSQKQPKPNTKKALDLLQEGKVAEAKDIIDAATTYEKTMNDGKTYYYRGLIYATIDTSSNEAIKSLSADAFQMAQKSFLKADSMAGGKGYFVLVPNTVTPIMKDDQLTALANYYLDKGIKKYQDDQDNEASLKLLDKSVRVFEKWGMPSYPNDTLAYFVVALVANAAEKSELAIENAEKYLAKGGKSRDIYLTLYQIYNQGEKQDQEKALEIVRRARKALPDEPNFPKMEIELLINMNKEAEAKTGLEEAIKKDPNDKLLHFYLGYVNLRAKNNLEARTSFENALKVEPTYYQAQYYLALTYLADVEKVIQDLNATGNTPADSKKRSALVQKRTQTSEVAIPHFEKAEKLKAPDKDSEIEVLQKLALLYYYVADDKNSARISKKLKALGVEE
jgi:predicted Zn-dependent protease